MRLLLTTTALLLTQFIWLSSLASSFARCTHSSVDCIQSEAPIPQGSIVNTEIEEDELLSHAHVTVTLPERPLAFHRTHCCQLVACAQIDARGCRPPPACA
jgi:hypothetical protein